MTLALMSLKAALSKVFPTDSIRFAFAYGSKVLPQAGADTSKSMLDLMLVVESPEAFHHHNLQANPAHYSRLARSLPSRVLSGLQRSGADVYFNTDIGLPDGRPAKYGIVSLGTFLSDLRHWDTLYLAGRLQKPIEPVLGDLEGCGAGQAQRQNLIFALHTALLLLPERFSRREMLEAIVGISYQGDVRRGLAENPKKVSSIVEGQYERLWAMYGSLLPEVGQSWALQSLDTDQTVWSQDRSQETRYLRCLALPSSMLSRIGRPKDFEMTPTMIRRAIAGIVRSPSAIQSAKGLVTADPAVSARYLWSKINKRFA